MTWKFPSAVLMIFALGCVPVWADTTATLSEKPNIIFIMADDLGYETLGSYGNEDYETPNLDKMAAGGMRFTQAYSNPLCTPTRVEVMTGKYNNRNYIVFGVMDKNEKTFGTFMKDAGYVTGITGKWQLLGSEEQQKMAGGRRGAYPQEVGFDNYCLWQVDQLGSRYKDPTVTTTSGTKTYKGEYGPDIYKNYALEFIEKNKDKPFFLYYPMALTHSPFEPTPDSPDYEKGSRKDKQKNFKAMVEYMDKIVGEVKGKVDALGLSRKTLIIFTGDNGTHVKITSTVNGEKIQGGKAKSTKYGTCVPLIAYWDGIIKPGQVNDNLVDFTDFLPTFMDVISKKLPDDYVCDGISFYPQLLDQKSKIREWVYCYYEPLLRNKHKAVWAHDKEWKLYEDGRFFNFKNDPLEQKPIPDSAISEEGKKVKTTLQKVLDSHPSKKE